MLVQVLLFIALPSVGLRLEDVLKQGRIDVSARHYRDDRAAVPEAMPSSAASRKSAAATATGIRGVRTATPLSLPAAVLISSSDTSSATPIP